MRKIAYFMLLALVAGSCTQCHRDAAGPEAGAESLKWDSVVTHEKYIPEVYGGDGPSYTIDVALDVPVGKTHKDSVVNMNICRMLYLREKTLLQEATADFLDTLRRNFDDEMADLYDPQDESGFPYTYALNMEGKVSPTSREDVIGYTLATYSFTGGAHGNSATLYLNMDARTGEVLTADSVFVAEKKDEIKSLIERQLMADNGCESLDSLRAKTAITVLGDVYVGDNNFILWQDGVQFIYNQYEIAPYAVGAIRVKLTYEQLEGCLKI